MENRIQKYKAKLSGDVRKQRFDSQRDQMIELETKASYELEKIEHEVKEIVNDQPALHLPYYIIFAKEVYSRMQRLESATLTHELTILMNKWASRGLNFIYMREIARRYSKPALDLYSVCEVPNLVGHWTFFTGSGAKTRDLSGNNYHGTLNLPAWAAGKIGRGLDFDGVDDYVDTTLTTNTPFLNGFTISAWINLRSLGEGASGSFGDIIDKSEGQIGQSGFSFNTDDLTAGEPRLNFRINAGTVLRSAVGGLSYGNWYHVLVTVNSSAIITHYINGVQSGTPGASGALSGITTSNALRIGNRAGATDRTFDGTIDEVMIFNRVLTLKEIKRIYNTTK